MNVNDARTSLLLVRVLGVKLAGIKFIEETVTEPKFIAEMLSAAKNYDHDIQNVYLEASQT